MSVALAVIEPQAWQRVHRQLKNLAQQQASRDYELGKLLLEGLRQSVHSHLGYASFTECVERLFGLSPRQVAERLRVAGALEELPALARALRNVEEHVRGRGPGDRPSDPADPRACTQVLRFEVTAEVLATCDVHSTAYDALKRLGFRESKVRSALTEVRTHVGMDASIERVLEAALALLSP